MPRPERSAGRWLKVSASIQSSRRPESSTAPASNSVNSTRRKVAPAPRKMLCSSSRVRCMSSTSILPNAYTTPTSRANSSRRVIHWKILRADILGAGRCVFPGEVQRERLTSGPHREPRDKRQNSRTAQQIQHRGVWRVHRLHLFEFEFLGPGDHRSPDRSGQSK